MCEKRQDPCVHMERGAESPGTYRKMAEFLCTRGRKGRSPACTDSQNLHTHRGPVYTWRKEQGPLHKRRGAGFHCTHTRGVEFLCQHREREGRGRGMVLLCTHREGLWILTGIPGSPEGPASPSSPALPCRSEESENAIHPWSTACCSSLLWGKSNHSPVLPSRLWTQLGQGAPAGQKSGSGSRIWVRFRVKVKVTV